MPTVSKFAADVIAPRVRDMDSNGHMDPAVVSGLFENGLMGVEAPEEYGGEECIASAIVPHDVFLAVCLRLIVPEGPSLFVHSRVALLILERMRPVHKVIFFGCTLGALYIMNLQKLNIYASMMSCFFSLDSTNHSCRDEFFLECF